MSPSPPSKPESRLLGRFRKANQPREHSERWKELAELDRRELVTRPTDGPPAKHPVSLPIEACVIELPHPAKRQREELLGSATSSSTSTSEIIISRPFKKHKVQHRPEELDGGSTHPMVSGGPTALSEVAARTESRAMALPRPSATSVPEVAPTSSENTVSATNLPQISMTTSSALSDPSPGINTNSGTSMDMISDGTVGGSEHFARQVTRIPMDQLRVLFTPILEKSIAANTDSSVDAGAVASTVTDEEILRLATATARTRLDSSDQTSVCTHSERPPVQSPNFSPGNSTSSSSTFPLRPIPLPSVQPSRAASFDTTTPRSHSSPAPTFSSNSLATPSAFTANQNVDRNFPCQKPGCRKTYRSANELRYHLENDSCSPSSSSKDPSCGISQYTSSPSEPRGNDLEKGGNRSTEGVAAQTPPAETLLSTPDRPPAQDTMNGDDRWIENLPASSRVSTPQRDVVSALTTSATSDPLRVLSSDSTERRTVSQFGGPGQLSLVYHSFEVSYEDYAAASRWSQRSRTFDPSLSHISFLLDCRKLYSTGVVGDSTAWPTRNVSYAIRINGERVGPYRPVTYGGYPDKPLCITSYVKRGDNIVEVFGFDDISDRVFSLAMVPPSAGETTCGIEGPANCGNVAGPNLRSRISIIPREQIKVARSLETNSTPAHYGIAILASMLPCVSSTSKRIPFPHTLFPFYDLSLSPPTFNHARLAHSTPLPYLSNTQPSRRLPPLGVQNGRQAPLPNSVLSTPVGSNDAAGRLKRVMFDATEDELRQKSEILYKRLNTYLVDPKWASLREARKRLPVSAHARSITEALRRHDVVVCSAGAGAGASTEIPQIVLDNWIGRQVGSGCNIMCSQPNRRTATTSAYQVAEERGERLGQTVGYQVRHDMRLPLPHGSITYCTVGILLRKLQESLHLGSRDPFRAVTHVIVDQIQEGDLDTSLLLYLLKQMRTVQPPRQRPLKVILISDSAYTDVIREYFSQADEPFIPVIDVAPTSFPVAIHYLDDIIKDVKKHDSIPKRALKDPDVTAYIEAELGCAGSILPVPTSNLHPLTDEMQKIPVVPPLLVALTILHVLRVTSGGHVLVFLPSLEGIVDVQEHLRPGAAFLERNALSSTTLSIHTLPPTTPPSQQRALFDNDSTVRRIILVTNIEDSLATIPGVTSVVDSGWSIDEPSRESPVTNPMRISRSTAALRATCAGHDRSRTYFCLLSRETLGSLSTRQTPVTHYANMENAILRLKGQQTPSAVEETLTLLIDPPSRDLVATAIANLKAAGALNEDDNPTSLGRLLIQLPTSATIGRLLLYGCLFRCLEPALTLAAILTHRPVRRSSRSALASQGNGKPRLFVSDILGVLRLYSEWSRFYEKGDRHGAETFVRKNSLATPTLVTIHEYRAYVFRSLLRLGIPQLLIDTQRFNEHEIRSSNPLWNVNSASVPLLTALVGMALEQEHSLTIEHNGGSCGGKVKAPLHEVNNRSHRDRPLHLFQGTVQDTSGRNVTEAQLPIHALLRFSKLDMLKEGLLCNDKWLVKGDSAFLRNMYSSRTTFEDLSLRIFERIAQQNTRAGAAVGYTQLTDALPEQDLRKLDHTTRQLVRILERSHSEDS
ncbi:hypothetical protein FRB99_002929 [Tulasnella sp. 403]|nr:hypothetical protein FRB99_002929 [Tulasnella sp. 403]